MCNYTYVVCKGAVWGLLFYTFCIMNNLICIYPDFEKQTLKMKNMTWLEVSSFGNLLYVPPCLCSTMSMFHCVEVGRMTFCALGMSHQWRTHLINFVCMWITDSCWQQSASQQLLADISSRPFTMAGPLLQQALYHSRPFTTAGPLLQFPYFTLPSLPPQPVKGLLQ